jgi:hypothetical protein
LVAVILGFTMTVVFMAPAVAMAKEDRDRVRFYGWVEFMPEGLHGTWIIGGQEVTTNPRTQFDEVEGPLMVGACAKVDVRGGLVHEIDSEPPRNCR